MGREERMQQEAMAHARNQFAQAVARGQAGFRDRMGRAVQPGDRVLFRNIIDPIYTVLSVDPVLDPRMPAGLMRAQITVTYPIDYQANVNNPHMVVIASREPLTAPAGADNNGAGTEEERAQATKDAQGQEPPGPVTPPVDEPPT